MLTNPDTSDRRSEQPAWAVDLVVCLLAAVVILPASIGAISDSPLAPAWLVLDIAAVVALHLLVAAARLVPRAVFAAGCVAMLVLAISPHLVTEGVTVPAVLVPSSLLFFYLLYAVALHCDSRTALVALGAGLAGAAAVSIRLGAATDWVSQVGSGMPGWIVLTGIAVVGPIAAWALGRLRSTRSAYRDELQRRAIADAASNERARIAAEMHDVVSHSLAVIVSQAEGGRMATSDDSAREVLQTISVTGRTALTDMRSMLGVLRSGDVRRDNPQPDVSGIAALVENARAELVETGTARPVSTAVGLAAYRIAQESLTNALKHGTGPAVVRITWTDELEVTITNPATMHIRGSIGSGLTGMRQRASAADGTFRAGPDGSAWLVTARFPVLGS